MANTLRVHNHLKHITISVSLSVALVVILVGNAHIYTNIGYPSFLEPIGAVLFYVGIVFAIPPGVVFWVLDKIGLAWELRGRESFIQLNMWLWVYCTFFYSFVIYFFLWLKQRRKQKTSNKAIE